MIKSAFISAFIGGLFGTFAFHVLDACFVKIMNRFFCEESFWERHQFEDSLEKADDLCQIGHTFKKDDFVCKKIAEKKWLSEISIPHTDHFYIGWEIKIENYVYEKIGDKTWTIERIN